MLQTKSQHNITNQKTIKLFFGILAGVAAYAIVGLSGLYLLKICWADYAIAAKDKSYTTEMLLSRLFIGIIAAIAAGISTSKNSDSMKSVWFAAAVIFTYAAYTHFVKVWPDYPVWYHLSYLLPIIPVIVLSSYLLQKNKSNTDTK